MTIQQKIDSLTEESVWIFTKQATDFDEAFRAAKLFNSAILEGSVNIEEYFTNNYQKFGIAQNNYRMLVIPQMFGLITKTPFFTKGTQYLKERPTSIFDKLNNYDQGSNEYNILKSEQILKVRIKPIIDTTEDGYDQVLLPLLFSYLTLRELKIKYNISEISIDQFYTYIATCKRFSEIKETAFLLSQNPNVSDLTNQFKSRSRIIPLFEKNSKLLDFSDKKVKINTNFDDYFFNNLIKKIDLNEIELILDDPNAYAYFLYNCQNFNINIIDNTTEINTESITPLKNILELSDENETYDSEYVEKVDEVKEENINFEIANDAFKNTPRYTESKKGTKVLKNPIFGKIAINLSGYKCNADENHRTFESKITKKDFMEAHHLVPMNKSKEVFEQQNINIDCVENLVSLCPNCHRAAHYGSNRVKTEILTKLYNRKVKEFKRIGLIISLEEILQMY